MTKSQEHNPSEAQTRVQQEQQEDARPNRRADRRDVRLVATRPTTSTPLPSILDTRKARKRCISSPLSSPFSPASALETPPAPFKCESLSGMECCMETDRKMVEVHQIDSIPIFTDCSGLSSKQADILAKKAIRLSVNALASKKGIDITSYRAIAYPFTGQAGIMSFGKNLYMITAHHVLMSSIKTLEDGKNYRFIHNHTCAHSVGDLDGQVLVFKREGVLLEEVKEENFLLEKQVPWNAAWDITYSHVPWPPKKTASRKDLFFNFDDAKHMRESVFEVVPKDYDYKKGQKIAMVVNCVGLTDTATPEGTGLDGFTKEQAVQNMGPDGCIKIFFGYITAVGLYFFYHDMNSNQGCSGATIVLLEDGEHWGKAVGVHTGHEPLNKQNVGFKINEGPRAPWWYRMGFPQLSCWYGIENECNKNKY